MDGDLRSNRLNMRGIRVMMFNDDFGASADSAAATTRNRHTYQQWQRACNRPEEYAGAAGHCTDLSGMVLMHCCALL